MRCPGCDRDLKGQKTTLKQPYQYVESGLDNVFLVGVTLYACQCGEELVEIPKVEQLDDVIAKVLIQKANPLSGAEVRFLRKYAELPAKDFAKILGVSPEHLSRVENKKVQRTGATYVLGAAADKLARVIAHKASQDESIKEVLLTLAETSEKKASHKAARLLFEKRPRSSQWKIAA